MCVVCYSAQYMVMCVVCYSAQYIVMCTFVVCSVLQCTVYCDVYS